jgi:hypothetical protein
MCLRPLARAMRLRAFALCAFVCTGAFIAPAARAQDTFEIRVEQYEQPLFGQFALEEHMNDVGIGTTQWVDSLAPTNHQFRVSSEFTAGVTSYFSLGAMLMTSDIPGHGSLDYAGWRVLPHFYLPNSLGLPVKLGLTTEFSFQRGTVDENPRTLELRPIVERSFGPLQLDLNAAIERTVTGPHKRDGWDFEPALRIAYNRNGISPALEYFGGMGAIHDIQPLSNQVHQIYPGFDWRLSPYFQWNLGIGVGLTPSGNRLVYKTILQFTFGRGVSSRSE